MKRSGSVGDILYEDAVKRDRDLAIKQKQAEIDSEIEPKMKFSLDKSEAAYAKMLKQEFDEVIMNLFGDFTEKTALINFDKFS
jgi:hypothetical protein